VASWLAGCILSIPGKWIDSSRKATVELLFLML